MFTVVELATKKLIHNGQQTAQVPQFVIYDSNLNVYIDGAGNKSSFRNHLAKPFIYAQAAQAEADSLNGIHRPKPKKNF